MVFSITSTELHQLLKVPQLVAHYMHHKKLDRTISFVDFIFMHYNENDNLKSDSQHNKLPFKSHCTIAGHIIIADVNFLTLNTHLSNFYFKKVCSKYKEVFYTSMLTESIWQPPKTA